VRLWPWGVTVVLAIEAMIQAGFLGGWLASSAHPGITLKAVLAGLSALAMGLQSGAVGSLGVSGITSTYVTGTMAGLLQAVALGTGDVRNRARRAAVIVGLVAGATVAGVLMVDARPVAPVVPLTVTVAALLTALWRLQRA